MICKEYSYIVYINNKNEHCLAHIIIIPRVLKQLARWMEAIMSNIYSIASKRIQELIRSESTERAIVRCIYLWEGTN